MRRAASNRGRFKGCAIAATNWRALSRGSSVSVSKVITYLTLVSTAVAPTTSEKRLPASPRNSAFRSASLPRLRS